MNHMKCWYKSKVKQIINDQIALLNNEVKGIIVLMNSWFGIMLLVNNMKVDGNDQWIILWAWWGWAQMDLWGMCQHSNVVSRHMRNEICMKNHALYHVLTSKKTGLDLTTIIMFFNTADDIMNDTCCPKQERIIFYGLSAKKSSLLNFRYFQNKFKEMLIFIWSIQSVLNTNTWYF